MEAPPSLPSEIQAQVETFAKQGVDASSRGELRQAMECFHQAIELIPTPPEQWKEAAWIFSALGDAAHRNTEWRKALDALEVALKTPAGTGNAFVHLRMGETRWKLGDHIGAAEALLDAYELGGEAIFEGEPPEYLAIVHDHLEPEDAELFCSMGTYHAGEASRLLPQLEAADIRFDFETGDGDHLLHGGFGFGVLVQIRVHPEDEARFHEIHAAVLGGGGEGPL